MLLILLGSVIAVIAGVALANSLPWEHVAYGDFMTLVGGVLTLAILIVWPVHYYSYLDAEARYYATNLTIMESRKTDKSEVERAALTTEIITANRELASAKYWNQTIFGDIIPDSFASLEYLK
ncbi:hypothetical protein [Paenibacillus sp. SI8]|uniref:hypothetical protein n=1 Tax=unclassified Paenibacillus TaxID=185978 RepID=UPI003465F3B7